MKNTRQFEQAADTARKAIPNAVDASVKYFNDAADAAEEWFALSRGYVTRAAGLVGDLSRSQDAEGFRSATGKIAVANSETLTDAFALFRTQSEKAAKRFSEVRTAATR